MNAEEMEALARRAAAGEGAAMDQLLGALWPVWYAVGLRCLRDPVLAEEAAQETALRVLRGLRRFDFQCSVRTWSIRIVLNASTDQVRRDRRAGAPMADVEPGADRTDPLTRLSVAQASSGGTRLRFLLNVARRSARTSDAGPNSFGTAATC